MNLYQAGYYRRGKQGSNAGWGIVSPSKGMSQIAKDGFKGIAAKLVELKGSANMPIVNTGLFLYDRFVYLMHVNYAAKGEDARGVTFVHGYCFNASDYYELCSKPELLCGISEDNFLMEYDSGVTAYPVVDTFSHENFKFSELLAKYKLSDEEYKKLVFGAINAIENYSNPLCIKLDLPSENYMPAFKELLYLIMMGLPYHLRIKMSFFSFSGASAAIYVSDHVEGNNYIDLDSKEFVIDSVRLTQFHFTKIYNTFPAGDYQYRDGIFKAIAEFINNSFENPYRDTGCAQIEAGFQAKVKKNDNEGIVSETAIELLTTFIKSGLTEHEDVYEYLAALLKVINDNSLVIQDEKLLNQIRNKYEKTEREDYQKEVCRLIAREYISQGEKSFAALNKLYSSSREQFSSVLSELKDKDEEYCKKYYYESYLPFVVRSLEKLKMYMKDCKNIDMEEYEVLLSLLSKLMKKEMQESSSYDELVLTRNKVNELLCKFPVELDAQISDIWNHAHFVFWNCFNFEDFEPEHINEYYKFNVEHTAQERYKGEENLNAIKVVKLAELFDETDEEQLSVKLYDILFEENDVWTISDKRKIQTIFRNQKEHDIDLNNPAGFDCMLALFYDYDEEKFDSISWGKKLLNKNGNVFEAFYISKVLKRSYILKTKKWKERLLESIQGDMKAAKKNNRADCSKFVLKGLKRYSDSLSGKEVKSEKALESIQSYANALHRVFIGELLLMAVIVLMKEMSSYEVMKGMPLILLGVIFLFLIMAMTGIKIYIAEGFDGLTENYGIEIISQLVIYLVLLLIMHAGIVITCLISSTKIMMIFILVYSVLAAVSAIVYNILAEDE